MKLTYSVNNYKIHVAKYNTANDLIKVKFNIQKIHYVKYLYIYTFGKVMS